MNPQALPRGISWPGTVITSSLCLGTPIHQVMTGKAHLGFAVLGLKECGMLFLASADGGHSLVASASHQGRQEQVPLS